MHSGSLNHIYASLARCIMCVQAPFQQLRSPLSLFSSVALYAFRLSEPYISTALPSFTPSWLYMHSGSLNHIYASLAHCIMCVQAPFHAHNINSFALLSPQWLYMHSGSLNHIYASLARCIMCVQAPFHAHNINSFALLSLSSPQWLYMHSGSLNHIYASLARCIMCVQAPFHAHNINSFALLSLSPS